MKIPDRTLGDAAWILSVCTSHRSTPLCRTLFTGPLLPPYGRTRPPDPKYVDKHLKAVMTKAGLPPMSFHKLRHTAATLALAHCMPTFWAAAIRATRIARPTRFTRHLLHQISERTSHIPLCHSSAKPDPQACTDAACGCANSKKG